MPTERFWGTKESEALQNMVCQSPNHSSAMKTWRVTQERKKRLLTLQMGEECCRLRFLQPDSETGICQQVAHWIGLFKYQQAGRIGSKIRQNKELSCDVVTTKVSVDPHGAGMLLPSCLKLKLSLYGPSGSYTSSSLQPLFWEGLNCKISTGNTPNSLLELGGQGNKCLGSGDTLQHPLQCSRRMSTLLSVYVQLSSDNTKSSLKSAS